MRAFNWSPSSLSSFETCARRHYEVKVARTYPDPPGPEALYGVAVHKSLELYCRDGEPMPPEHRIYQGVGDKVRALPGEKFFEQKLGITRDFAPCDFDAPEVWHRCIVDVLIVHGRRAAAIDYKTGKPKNDLMQLNMNAAAVMVLHPEVQTVDLRYWWISKGGHFTKHTLHRADLPALWERMIPRAKRMEDALETNRWPPNPSGLCKRWCPVKSCSFHGT